MPHTSIPQDKFHTPGSYEADLRKRQEGLGKDTMAHMRWELGRPPANSSGSRGVELRLPPSMPA